MIKYTFINNFYGGMILAVESDKIIGLAFGKEKDSVAILEDLLGTNYFQRADKDLALHAQAVVGKEITRSEMVFTGTPFQVSVWNELLKIKKGETKTYSDIALSIGHPKAVRAVGTAIGRNKISYIIPCHRVIQKSGALGNYRWGISIKEALLKDEL